VETDVEDCSFSKYLQIDHGWGKLSGVLLSDSLTVQQAFSCTLNARSQLPRTQRRLNTASVEHSVGFGFKGELSQSVLVFYITLLFVSILHDHAVEAKNRVPSYKGVGRMLRLMLLVSEKLL
jgi:hypothetical protein